MVYLIRIRVNSFPFAVYVVALLPVGPSHNCHNCSVPLDPMRSRDSCLGVRGCDCSPILLETWISTPGWLQRCQTDVQKDPHLLIRRWHYEVLTNHRNPLSLCPVQRGELGTKQKPSLSFRRGRLVPGGKNFEQTNLLAPPQ
jgi:hypothetical protein